MFSSTCSRRSLCSSEMCLLFMSLFFYLFVCEENFMEILWLNKLRKTPESRVMLIFVSNFEFVSGKISTIAKRTTRRALLKYSCVRLWNLLLRGRNWWKNNTQQDLQTIFRRYFNFIVHMILAFQAVFSSFYCSQRHDKSTHPDWRLNLSDKFQRSGKKWGKETSQFSGNHLFRSSSGIW